MRSKSLCWLSKINVLIDGSLKEFFIVYQEDLATELLSDKCEQYLQSMLRQKTALVRKQGAYFLCNNFSVLLVLGSEKHLRKYGQLTLELFNPREIKNEKINLLTETLSLISEISRSRTVLHHADIFEVLKKQLSKDEWLRFHGRNKFLISDYLDQVGISQSTFDRSRGRRL